MNLFCLQMIAIDYSTLELRELRKLETNYTIDKKLLTTERNI
jgi:hypothetical protein